VEVVDTATSTVSTSPHSLSPARAAHCGVSLGESLVVTAGYDDGANLLYSVVR
jgi:hypothetical protein